MSNVRPHMSVITRLFGSKKAPPYRLTSGQSQDLLGPWAAEFPLYTDVVGYSSLGHVFMRDPSIKDYAVLHPFKSAAKSYGEHASTTEFERAILCEEGFGSYVLRHQHVEAIARLLGPLGKDEVYIPQPYPILGGSDSPETYSKGNVWVFVNIVAQAVGLK